MQLYGSLCSLDVETPMYSLMVGGVEEIEIFFNMTFRTLDMTAMSPFGLLRL